MPYCSAREDHIADTMTFSKKLTFVHVWWFSLFVSTLILGFNFTVFLIDIVCRNPLCLISTRQAYPFISHLFYSSCVFLFGTCMSLFISINTSKILSIQNRRSCGQHLSSSWFERQRGRRERERERKSKISHNAHALPFCFCSRIHRTLVCLLLFFSCS